MPDIQFRDPDEQRRLALEQKKDKRKEITQAEPTPFQKAPGQIFPERTSQDENYAEIQTKWSAMLLRNQYRQTRRTRTTLTSSYPPEMQFVGYFHNSKRKETTMMIHKKMTCVAVAKQILQDTQNKNNTNISVSTNNCARGNIHVARRERLRL